MKGWVKLHRSIWSDPVIWGNGLREPFDRRSAWVDLILMANHEPAAVRIGGDTVTIGRGQLWTSFRVLSRRWGWSVKKVRAYIATLENAHKVTAKGTQRGTTITLSNYDFYQSQQGHTEEHTKGHTEGHTKGHTEEHAQSHVNADILSKQGHTEEHTKGHTEGHTKGHTEGTQTRKKEDKNNNNNNISAPGAAEKRTIEEVFNKAWSAYPEKRGKARVTDKDKRRLADIGLDHVLRAIERYAAEVRASSFKHFQNGSTFFHSGIDDYLDDVFEPTQERAIDDSRSAPGSRNTDKFNNAPERSCNMAELELALRRTN